MTTILNDRLVEAIMTMIDDDGGDLSDESKYLVLAALESDAMLADALGGHYIAPPELPARSSERYPEPIGAFLKSITVCGFRGVGPSETLALHPGPGMTVVAGRNGSGKSTFAEALEVALTNTSHRWRDRSAAWQRNWGNLHVPRPREIRVAISEEGAGTTTVGVDWPGDTERFDDLQSWVQRRGRKQESGTDSLGWADSIELYKPILSYEELGGLLTAEPKKLYDALSGILGLDRVTEGQHRLDAQLKVAAEPVKRAKTVRSEPRRSLEASPDHRAAQAAKLVRQHKVDIDALRTLAAGSTPTSGGVLTGLREIADYQLPARSAIEDAAAALRTAVGAMAASADEGAARASRQIALLRQAVELHSVHGDQPCPVCRTGTLDGSWRTAVLTELAFEDEEMRRLGAARRELTSRRNAAIRLLDAVGPLIPPPDVELATIARAVAARAAWCTVPSSDEALAEHLLTTADELHTAVTALREEAEAAWQERQDAWTPLATKIAAWVDIVDQSRAAEPQVTQLQAASTWLKDHTERLRNQQLEPLADDARRIWAALRQESNVDLKAITLPKPVGNIRQVEIAAEVDGLDAGALGVMSTGELHALALALFLPRATRPESPFRFVVLDDPIQAMDPSKIDGFVSVLAELAESRQVVVFSHDDRLPEAVRRLAPSARVTEVSRSAGSVVTIRDARD